MEQKIKNAGPQWQTKGCSGNRGMNIDHTMSVSLSTVFTTVCSFCTLRSTGAIDIFTVPSTIAFPLQPLARLILVWDQLTSRSLNLCPWSSPRYCPARHANSGRQLNLWDHMLEQRACSQTTMVQPICVLWGTLAGHGLDLKTNWRSDCLKTTMAAPQGVIVAAIASVTSVLDLNWWNYGTLGW